MPHTSWSLVYNTLHMPIPTTQLNIKLIHMSQDMSHVILLPLIQQYARECAHNLFTCVVKNPIIAQLHIMDMQDATILCHTHLNNNHDSTNSQLMQLLALHIPSTSGRGQPYNTSFKYIPIIQVANTIFHRECNSTLYQQTSWYLQHMVLKINITQFRILKYHKVSHYFISCACLCPCHQQTCPPI